MEISEGQGDRSPTDELAARGRPLTPSMPSVHRHCLGNENLNASGYDAGIDSMKYLPNPD